MATNLGKYDLNRVLRNPMLIHVIQDELEALQGQSIMAAAIRWGAVDSLQDCLKMIVGQYRENPRLMTGIMGIDLLRKIEEYRGKSFLESQNTLISPDDIPVGLFQQPGQFGYMGDN